MISVGELICSSSQAKSIYSRSIYFLSLLFCFPSFHCNPFQIYIHTKQLNKYTLFSSCLIYNMSNKKQLQQMSQFSIIRESPGDKQLINSSNKKSSYSNHTREIKFKYEEPIGIRPEDDDDLETCPARTRASWPHQIVPWWKPTDRYEKPPYSYATLIAHAILTSKNGRLTLSDIYKWISEAYPYYKRGQKGWQVNSQTRHPPPAKHCAHHPPLY